MSPLEIEILLHYHARGDDYRGGDFSAPAVRSAIDTFKGQDELLEADGGERSYRLTERGRVFVQALLNVPLPVKSWSIPYTPPCQAVKGAAA